MHESRAREPTRLGTTSVITSGGDHGIHYKKEDYKIVVTEAESGSTTKAIGRVKGIGEFCTLDIEIVPESEGTLLGKGEGEG